MAARPAALCYQQQQWSPAAAAGDGARRSIREAGVSAVAAAAAAVLDTLTMLPLLLVWVRAWLKALLAGLPGNCANPVLAVGPPCRASVERRP